MVDSVCERSVVVVLNTISDHAEMVRVTRVPRKVLVPTWRAASFLAAGFGVGLNDFPPNRVRLLDLPGGLSPLHLLSWLSLLFYLVALASVFSVRAWREYVSTSS